MGNASFKNRNKNKKKNHLTESLLVAKDMDVRDVYDIVEVTGKGSVSTIYTIRRKQDHGTTTDTAACTEGDTANNDSSKDTTLSSHRCSHASGPQHHPQANNSNNNSSELYALKEIDLDRVEPSQIGFFENEVSFLRKLSHPFLIRAYEIFRYRNEDGKNLIGIVLELCDGDLYSRMPYTEEQAGTILYQLVEAVHYMHQRHIIHRDIKLENILFESSEPGAAIKLIDFGLSAKFAKNENFEEMVGTVYTMAPEVFMGQYTQAADMWSIGVVAYVLLSGEKPFWAERWSELRQKIIEGDYNFDSPAWNNISIEAKGFVTKLLEYDPLLRSTSERALQNRWLSKFKPNVDESTMRDVLSQLNDAAPKSEFEQLAWLVVAHKANPDEVVSLRDVFEELDLNHDGKINQAEFKAALVNILGIAPKEAQLIFRQVDIHNAGSVDYTTFLAALMGAQGRLQDKRIAEVFDHFDVDRCGHITQDHLRQVLGPKVSTKFVDRLIEEIDTHKDGHICFNDFKVALNKKHDSKDARKMDRALTA